MDLDLRFLDELNEPLHIILLNYELSSPHILLRLLERAQSIVCADGGALRLAKFLNAAGLSGLSQLRGLLHGKLLAIIGDLDSLYDHSFVEESQGEIEGREATKGCLPARNGSAGNFPGLTVKFRGGGGSDLITEGFRIIEIKNEYNTDFVKTLAWLTATFKAPQNILVDGIFGGRFDQTLANLQVPYRLQGPHDHVPDTYRLPVQAHSIAKLVLLGSGNLATLIPSGFTTLRLPRQMCSRVCGLLPLMPVTGLTTTGLRWNIEPKWVLSMCEMISSSNEVVDLDQPITFDTKSPILWVSQINCTCAELCHCTCADVKRSMGNVCKSEPVPPKPPTEGGPPGAPPPTGAAEAPPAPAAEPKLETAASLSARQASQEIQAKILPKDEKSTPPPAAPAP